jgi:hypothetical protein
MTDTPLTGFATVSTVLAALADIDGNTVVAVQTGPEERLLWINEINLIGVQEHHAVDETTILLPSTYVAFVVEPQKPFHGITKHG